jgi:hypothetical protein
MMMQTTQLYTLEAQAFGGETLHVLGTPDRLLDLRRITARSCGIPQLIRDLEDAGFVITQPQSVVFDPSDPVWAGSLVRFPDTAPHSYAGRSLQVVSAADGLPALVDAETEELLMADDRPWRKADAHPMKGGQLIDPDMPFEQIPLGPVIVPEGQFRSKEDEAAFIADLRLAGYEITT